MWNVPVLWGHICPCICPDAPDSLNGSVFAAEQGIWGTGHCAGVLLPGAQVSGYVWMSGWKLCDLHRAYGGWPV